MLYLIHKIDGLADEYVLYFINWRIVVVVLNLYLRKKILLMGQKGGNIVDCPSAVCILMLINLP